MQQTTLSRVWLTTLSLGVLTQPHAHTVVNTCDATTAVNSLDMYTVVLSEYKGVGHKVVFHPGVHLYNVTPLPSDIEVEDPPAVRL